MVDETDWDHIRPPSHKRLLAKGLGSIHFALVFGVIAIAFSMLFVDMAQEHEFASLSGPEQFDMTPIGGISPKRSYVIRHSILQTNPHASCIIDTKGYRSPECY